MVAHLRTARARRHRRGSPSAPRPHSETYAGALHLALLDPNRWVVNECYDARASPGPRRRMGYALARATMPPLV